jgi:D-beta-D-heptose 7-phosphate kinase / D-beta-D-heptose 1-phosphate adenosyltransferase
MNRHPDYKETISLFEKKRILVIGDLIVDVYLNGRSTRLCPEAPVPLVDVEERSIFLGGAANTVCNFKALGAHTDFISIIGDDEAGTEAIKILQRKQISTEFILQDTTRKTLVKTRILSSGHVITRFDEGTTNSISSALTEKLCHLISNIYRDYDAIIISDYDKGIVTSSFIEHLHRMQGKSPVYLAIY